MQSSKSFITFFLLPALLIYCILAVIPIFQAFYFSVFDWPGIQGFPLEFVGFENFVKMVQSRDFSQSMGNVGRFILLNVALQIPLGYGLAILLSDYMKGFKAFKLLYFIPVVLPLTATSLLWKFIFLPNETGVLNQVLGIFGVEPVAWLLGKSTAMNSIIIANVWTGFGYHLVIAFAAITTIPSEILEAARIDGCKGGQMVRRIIVPMIWNVMKVSVILIITGSLKNFDIVFVMTEGGPNGLTHVPSTLMYYEAFKYDHYGVGSAIAVFIFLLSLGMSIVSMRLMRRETVEY